MRYSEGIIFQGCGGDLQEWLDGVNGLFTKEGLLLDGTKFEEATAFQNNNITNLLFKFTEDIKLNFGKLAVWRIASHEQFGCKWLSDYVDNYLNGFYSNKDITNKDIIDKRVADEYAQFRSETITKNSKEVFDNSREIYAKNAFHEALSGDFEMEDNIYKSLCFEKGNILDELYSDYEGEIYVSLATPGDTAEYIADYCERHHTEILSLNQDSGESEGLNLC